MENRVKRPVYTRMPPHLVRAFERDAADRGVSIYKLAAAVLTLYIQTVQRKNKDGGELPALV